MTVDPRPTRRYPTRVDWWLGLVVIAVPVVVIASAVLLTVSGDVGAAAPGWVAVVAVIVLYAALVWPVAYELDADALVIRFGLARSRVRYDRIRSVRPTRSILASPALSIDRLAIDQGGRIPVTISPADRDGFLADLDGRAPHLHREGDALVSAGS